MKNETKLTGETANNDKANVSGLLPPTDAEARKLAEQYLDEKTKAPDYEYGSYAIVNQYTLADFIAWLRKR